MGPPAVRPAQLQTLRQRHARIQRRLDELAALPARPAAGYLALTRRRARESQLAARRALIAYRDALYRSAQAQGSAATAHQRAARTTGDARHEQMAAFHRAAAADRRTAGQIQA